MSTRSLSKPSRLFAAVGTVFSAALAVNSSLKAQQCVPTVGTQQTTLTTCAMLGGGTGPFGSGGQSIKQETWSFSFPDGTPATQHTFANGGCGYPTACLSTPPELDCWPEMDTPVTGPGSWSQTAYDAAAEVVSTSQCYPYIVNPVASTWQCYATGAIRTFVVNHTCPIVAACAGIQCGNTCYSYDPPCTDSNGYGGPTSPAYCCGDNLCCPSNSPIIIDTKDEGFHLTGEPDGVSFAMAPGATPIKISWTDAAHSNGWLALDRDGNGLIDNMAELFGNLTPQPKSSDPNGFTALEVFDDPRQGGNGNGVIDPGDAIYSSLRVWVDKNHNGISEPDELYTLQELGLFSISLHYQSNRPFTDTFGNSFRFRSTVTDFNNGQYDKKCYDVFLLSSITNAQ